MIDEQSGGCRGEQERGGRRRTMQELWAWIDSLPVIGLLALGMLAIGISYILDVLADAREEWK